MFLIPSNNDFHLKRLRNMRGSSGTITTAYSFTEISKPKKRWYQFWKTK